MFHIDNASPDTPQMIRNFFTRCGLRELDHPSYSPDLAPSDFYLFGKVKDQLIGESIQDEKEFLHEVVELLGSISTFELQNVFRNWIKRLEGVIEIHGQYVS
jgi:histone-lysine N-methyltransferase SETMAR